ncbi:MAG: hypothetical protein J7L34_09575 [Thermotogaceae bacterium]|nr:hypothetical protein [Thermotogaceae bacterium]
MTLFLSVIMLSIGILVFSGIIALKFIPKDFLEMLRYNLSINSFMLYGVVFFTTAGFFGSISVLNFESVKVKRLWRILASFISGVSAVFVVLSAINWDLADSFYVLIFLIILLFMNLSLMFLGIYSIFEEIRGNRRR